MRRVAILVLVIALVAMPSIAFAGWTIPGAGRTYSKASSVPGGNTPTAVATGRNVTLSWAQSLLSGNPIGGYTVARYSSSGAVQIIDSGCSGTVVGLTCTEAAVPPGTWNYAVTPRLANWTGSESAPSANVTIGSPTLALSTGTVSALPATLTGTVSNFITGQSLTFRLDDPASGPTLTGSAVPASIPFTGGAAVSITLPAGTSPGSHTVYAIGGQGDVAQAAITVLGPRPVSLSIANVSGVAGSPDLGDTVTVKFSERLAVASMCSTWSGDANNQAITSNNVVTVSIANNTASGNDLLTVATSPDCVGGFRFGSIDLGSGGFVTTNMTFGGSGGNASKIAWNATTFELTVTLGKGPANTPPGSVVTSVTATYSSPSGLLSSDGGAVTGSTSRFGVHF